MEHKDYFDFMLECVREVSIQESIREPQAFIKWFINMYYLDPKDVFISDGSRDGKVDVFFQTIDDSVLRYHIINSKFTREYKKLAPISFYNEIQSFCNLIKTKKLRETNLEKSVKAELRTYYKKLYEAYDDGLAELVFLTNYKKNDNQYEVIKNLPIKCFHLDDIIQHLADDLDGAMPRTRTLTLFNITALLKPEISESAVSTTIVFARLIDFINYMKKDPFDLIFARNVRLGLGRTSVNRAIKETFIDSPGEFVFSNNGITLLCEDFAHKPSGELNIENPRVVNGAQTLYSIRDVPNPSTEARVMVRIIRIPPLAENEIKKERKIKRDIINKISIRSNQQNPIKQWNLVCQDDFQLGLFRYFRKKEYFYERRDKEWSHRSRKLKSLGIKMGPNIRRMAQLIAAYKLNDKKLGPANARLSVAQLFHGTAYDNIRKTPIELVYKIFLLSKLYDECWSQLSGKKYSRKIRSHFYFAGFSLMIKALEQFKVTWDKIDLFERIEKDSFKDIRLWKRLLKSCVDHIYNRYRIEDCQYKKKEGNHLSMNNYFKSVSYMDKLMSLPMPADIKKATKDIAKNIRS